MATAVTTRGRIVERRTAGQLVVTFATNIPFGLSLFLLIETVAALHLSRVLCGSCNMESQAPRNLDESDLLVRYVRGISLGVSSYRSRRVVLGQEIPRAPRSRPDAAGRK